MKVRLRNTDDAEGIFNVQKLTWIDTYPNVKYGVTRESIIEKFSDTEKKIVKTREKIKDSEKG